MTAITQKLAAIRAFSLSVWLHSLVERAVARVIGWVFSMPAVQFALVKQVRCGSPIGNALVGQIEDCVSNQSADDISGLERLIEREVGHCFDEFIRDFEIDAENVKNLKEEVGTIVDEYELRATNIAGLDDEIDERL